MTRLLAFAFLSIVLSSCGSKQGKTAQSGPQPINPDEDLCQLCWMPIPDNAFASEAIKGLPGQGEKVYKFDAVECLVGFSRIARLTDSTGVQFFVRDFNSKTWTKAQQASYFRGDITSPMGGGIVAFADSLEAAKLLKDFKGAVVNWERVLQIPWEDILEKPRWKR